jgi:hypothetical protein
VFHRTHISCKRLPKYWIGWLNFFVSTFRSLIRWDEFNESLSIQYVEGVHDEWIPSIASEKIGILIDNLVLNVAFFSVCLSTCTLYMSPLTAGMLSLPCRPCSGPWKLKFGDYYLVLTILGVLGMVRKHLRLRPTFFDADFCSGSVWELSWGAKSLLTASAESAGNPLNYSLTSKYEFVLS